MFLKKFPDLNGWSIPNKYFERFKYSERSSAYGYLLVESATDKELETLLNEVKEYATNNKALGKILTLIKNRVGADTNPRWVLGTVIEVLYDRDFIDEDDQSYYRKHVGL